MYSFAQRSDTKVVDEPLYAHYLSVTDAAKYHPGSDETLSTMENDGNKVIEKMLGPHEKDIIFFKQMTHHLRDLNLSFLSETINVILTRDPIEMLPSYDKEVKNPNMNDVGYEAHEKLYNYLESINQTPLVLDSRRILEQPEDQLKKLCEILDIPFEKQMLSWEKGPIPEDGCWANYWYSSVHKSTGFLAYKPKSEAFPEHLRDLLVKCKPIYERLSALSF